MANYGSKTTVPVIQVGTKPASLRICTGLDLRELVYSVICAQALRASIYLGSPTNTGGRKIKLYRTDATYEGYIRSDTMAAADMDEFVGVAAGDKIGREAFDLVALLFDGRADAVDRALQSMLDPNNRK